MKHATILYNKNKQEKPKRSRQVTESGSSTVDETTLIDPLKKEIRKRSIQQSTIFHILRYPLLLLTTLLILLNLFCFFLAKQIVTIYEFGFQVFSKASKIEKKWKKQIRIRIG